MAIDRVAFENEFRMLPIHVTPQVWKWAFQKRDDSLGYQMTHQKELPVKVLIISSKNPPYFVIKGPPTLLLLLAQQKYPLTGLTNAVVRDLEQNWEMWLNECLIAEHAGTNFSPRLLLPQELLLELPKIIALDSQGAGVLRKIVEEVWTLEVDEKSDEGAFKWVPVFIRDKIVRDLQLAWVSSPRIERVSTQRDEKGQRTKYRLNNVRNPMVPEDRPQWSWDKIKLKPCQCVLRSPLIPLQRGATARPIETTSDALIVSFYEDIHKQKLTCRSVYGACLWHAREDGRGHVVEFGGKGHGDLQVFMDLATPYGSPTEVYMVSSYSGGAEVLKLPIELVKSAAKEWTAEHYGTLLHLARATLYLRNEARLCVDLLFPYMSLDKAFVAVQQLPEFFEQIDEWHILRDGEEGYRWYLVFSQADAFAEYKKALARRAGGEVDHPLRLFVALDELAEKNPAAAAELGKMLAEEDEDAMGGYTGDVEGLSEEDARAIEDEMEEHEDEED